MAEEAPTAAAPAEVQEGDGGQKAAAGAGLHQVGGHGACYWPRRQWR